MNLKILHYALIFLLSLPLCAQSSESTDPDGAVVFMYHRFDEQKYPSTNITIGQFQYQLDYLEKNHYNVWPLSKILNHIKDKKPLPKKTVALTMDDAYMSVYTKAYPMLKKKNFPFTVFVNTNPIDRKSKAFLTWELMRIMQRNGAEFANHTLSHDALLPLNDETDDAFKKRVVAEVQGAQSRLQKELGADTNTQPKLFSYPFGEYNMQSAEIVKGLGYLGITQTSGPIGEKSDLMAVTRFPMAEPFATPKGFFTKLNTLPMPIDSASPREPLVKKDTRQKLRIKLERPLRALGCYMSSGEAIEMKHISKTEIEISSTAGIKPPRMRYTCTAPANNGKWYWYSHLWIVQK